MPILDKNDKSKLLKYEKFIEESPYGHCMQSIHWAQVKDNWESDYVYLEDEFGSIRAALSVISVKNDGIHSFMYAPRGPVCDLKDRDSLLELFKEVEVLQEEKKAFLLRMDPEVLYDEDLIRRLESYGLNNLKIRTRGLAEKSFTNPRNNMILRIGGRSPEQIFADYKSKRKNQINKTYANGLLTRRVRFSDEDFDSHLEKFYELIGMMAKRQGINHRPIEYFRRIFSSFEDVVLYETYDNEEVLSSCIVIFYNKKAFYIYAASSDHKRKLDASLQMCNEAIKDTAARGFEEFDFGGVFNISLEDGLYVFKNKFTGDGGLHEYVGELDLVYIEELYENFNK